MAKIGKSIRVEQNVLDYITSYKGNGFNEQFENIIIDAMLSEPERIKRVAYLNDELEMLEKKRSALFLDIRKIENINSSVLNIIRSVGELEDKLN